MAQALNKAKRRIASVKSTKKITEAMGLIATVKLKKSKSIMDQISSYSKEIINIVSDLFAKVDDENLYVNEGCGKKNLVIIINSNLGLCASYNSNMFSFVNKVINKDDYIIMPVGIKGLNNYKKEGFEILPDIVSFNNKITYEECRKLGNTLHENFIKGEFKSIQICFTKYVNSLKFIPTLFTLLPITKNNIGTKNVGYSPIYDTKIDELISKIMPIYMTSSIYQKLIESEVSEQASRRTAMDNANDNADELLEKLTLEFNKARQASITQEITEVVASQIN